MRRISTSGERGYAILVEVIDWAVIEDNSKFAKEQVCFVVCKTIVVIKRLDGEMEQAKLWKT
jgi:hypothetical protein